MKTFVKKQIQTNEVSYWDAIPKLSIRTFNLMTKKVKVKAGDEKSIIVDADRDLFLLIIANARQVNLREVLSYELSPILCSLAHQESFSWHHRKACDCSPSSSTSILDGMAVIQMIESESTATFGELAKHY